MRFDGLDLNLLVAFEALIEERNVSAAARRLHLSQPAVTGALNRLRDYFRDDLLVLNGRRMIPTHKAETLIGPVRRALLQIRGEITRADEFDAATTHREFVIVASDYAYTIAVAKMIAAAANDAPFAKFEIVPPSDGAVERVERAEVDLMITVAPYALPQLKTLELWRDEEVVISWAGAGFEALSIEEFFEAGHAVASFGPDRRPSVIDRHIARLGHERRIEVMVPSFADLCQAIVGTRRLATMHRRYADHFARFLPIVQHRPWEPFPEIIQVAQWHPIRAGDPGISWVIECLKAHARAESTYSNQLS